MIDDRKDPCVILPAPEAVEGWYTWVERKGTYAKEIWSDPGGKKVAVYRNIPTKEGIPVHRLVNDANQDLCGSWFRSPGLIRREPGDTEFVIQDYAVIAHRVLNGLKPSGNFYGPAWAIRQWEEAFFDGGRFAFQSCPAQGREGVFEFSVARTGTLEEVFGAEYLDAVESYYRECLPPGLRWKVEELIEFRTPKWQLFDLFKEDWANGKPSPLLVGLSLGYPIENTVSGHIS